MIQPWLMLNNSATDLCYGVLFFGEIPDKLAGVMRCCYCSLFVDFFCSSLLLLHLNILLDIIPLGRSIVVIPYLTVIL
jgi:hypothetical protein